MMRFIRAFLQLLFSFFLIFLGSLEGGVVTPTVTAYFSPEDHLEKRLIEMIEEENKNIYICVYSFTHRGIMNALIAAKKRGVDVEVVVDRFSIKVSSSLYRLSNAGIPVYVWDPIRPRRQKAHRPRMHHRFCLFGNRRVWTGSFNFTDEAARLHQENIVIIDDPILAHKYKNQFCTTKIRSCVPLSSFLASYPHKRPKKVR